MGITNLMPLIKKNAEKAIKAIPFEELRQFAQEKGNKD
jgi:hypothetical protein